MTTLVCSQLAAPPNFVVIYIMLTESDETSCLPCLLLPQKTHSLEIAISTIPELKSIWSGQLLKRKKEPEHMCF